MKTVYLVADFTCFTPQLHVRKTFQEAGNLMAELDSHWQATGRANSTIVISELPVLTTKYADYD